MGEVTTISFNVKRDVQLVLALAGWYIFWASMIAR